MRLHMPVHAASQPASFPTHYESAPEHPSRRHRRCTSAHAVAAVSPVHPPQSLGLVYRRAWTVPQAHSNGYIVLSDYREPGTVTAAAHALTPAIDGSAALSEKAASLPTSAPFRK